MFVQTNRKMRALDYLGASETQTSAQAQHVASPRCIQPVQGLGLDSGTAETKLLHFRQIGESVETSVLTTLPSLKGLFGPEAEEDTEGRLESLKSTINEAVAQIKPAYCFAGVTSWYRTSSASERQGLDDFFAAELPGFKLLKLTGEEEARYESIAVGFAAEKSCIGVPDMQISAGGGSMQLVQGESLFSIEEGFRKGQSQLMAGTEPRAKVCGQLQNNAHSAFTEFKEKHQNFAVNDGMKVVCISAAYYCAKGAGVDCSGAPVKGAVALAQFRAKLEALTQCSSFTDSPNLPLPKKTAQEIANLTIFCECFEQLVHPNAIVYFKREWVLDNVPFITTWSAGYFLRNCSSNKMCHPIEETRGVTAENPPADLPPKKNTISEILSKTCRSLFGFV